MNIFAWILQILFGLLFLGAGTMKAFNTGKMQSTMAWAKNSSASFVKFVGVVEILGGIGLILPWALDILPMLTVLAAIGLAIVMLLAIGVHAKLKEYSSIVSNVVFLVLLVVIAVIRL